MASREEEVWAVDIVLAPELGDDLSYSPTFLQPGPSWSGRSREQRLWCFVALPRPAPGISLPHDWDQSPGSQRTPRTSGAVQGGSREPDLPLDTCWGSASVFGGICQAPLPGGPGGYNAHAAPSPARTHRCPPPRASGRRAVRWSTEVHILSRWHRGARLPGTPCSPDGQIPSRRAECAADLRAREVCRRSWAPWPPRGPTAGHESARRGGGGSC